MQFHVTFRNLAVRPEVKSRAEVLFSKLDRFLDTSAEGQLVVSAEHGNAIAEVVITNRGHTHKAKHEDTELRGAIDLVFHTIENQLRRAKDRRQDRRERGPDDTFGGSQPPAE